MPRTNNRKTSFPVLLVVLGGVLVLGALIALAVQPKQNAPVQQVDNHEGEIANIERVTLENAKNALDQAQAVFVDVRGPAAFEAGRIPDSLLIPVNELETRWSELNPDDWIITYCT
jgi:3-mercaptopyruvate sulfurtransferase SseA